MHRHQRAVLEFHRRFELTVNSQPTIPDDKDIVLRINLIMEESRELFEAALQSFYDDLIDETPTRSLIGIADACGDLKYVIYGAALTYGIILPPDRSARQASIAEFGFFSSKTLRNLPSALIPKVIAKGMEVNRKFIEASVRRDLTALADSLTILIDFTDAVERCVGINIEPVFDEIQRSNMSKIWPDGKVHRRESDGKILKPETYSPADIKKVLSDQMANS